MMCESDSPFSEVTNNALFEIAEEVCSREKAISYLQGKGIFPLNMKCPKGHEAVLQLSRKRERWRCNHRECRVEQSLKSGTFLEDAKLPYSTIVQFIYAWAKELVTIKFAKEQLGMNKNTTVEWCNIMRGICADSLIQKQRQIGGEGRTVEIDESLFAKRKLKKGSKLPQQWVFGGVCRETKDCFLVSVPDRSARTLIPLIKKYIAPGTTIISDQWASYKDLAKDVRFQHLAVNHSLKFVDSSTVAHKQPVESLWNQAKSRNKRRWGNHGSLLETYLCEFMWRHTLRDEDPFPAILEAIATLSPPPTSFKTPYREGNDEEVED